MSGELAAASTRLAAAIPLFLTPSLPRSKSVSTIEVASLPRLRTLAIFTSFALVFATPTTALGCPDLVPLVNPGRTIIARRGKLLDGRPVDVGSGGGEASDSLSLAAVASMVEAPVVLDEREAIQIRVTWGGAGRCWAVLKCSGLRFCRFGLVVAVVVAVGTAAVIPLAAECLLRRAPERNKSWVPEVAIDVSRPSGRCCWECWL
mmetsp:Transcript_15367/g.33251  ORF Transcript_15367/g.33251 Transcript_15367/m.33251 type:complete len:205 (-) Transcript_15367:1273-1887(-)